MARYVVRVRSPRTPAESFAYMADLRNFALWDPGVTQVSQVTGEGHGANASFDVTVKSPGTDLVLRYKTTEYEPDTKVVAVAESKMLISDDTITVAPDGDGSVVTYDASLRLKGFLGLADPLLGLAFNRIGDNAAKGLLKALDGTKVTADK